MGIFGKIFGGKQDAPVLNDAAKPDASASFPPPAATAAADATPGGIPARRERSKPKSPAELAEAAGENAALIDAIQGVVRGDTPESRKTLYQAILDAQVYLVVMGDTTDAGVLEAGEVNLQQGQQVSLATIRDPKGGAYLPAFTDVDRMSKTLPDDARYLRVPFPAACKMFLQGTGEGIVINPGQAPSGVITRGEAEILAQNVAPEIGENGQLVGNAPRQMKIAIGKLQAQPPESFVEAIRAAAAEHSIVSEVHLFLAGIEDQLPRQMIGVVVDEGVSPEQMHPTFDAIGKAAFAARAADSESFDMMPLSAELLDAIRPLEGVVYSRG